MRAIFLMILFEACRLIYRITVTETIWKYVDVHRGVAGGSAGSARADPKFWSNSTVLLPVPTLNYSLFLLVPTLTKIPSYGPAPTNVILEILGL